MDKKTREALEGSIKKWQRIVMDNRAIDKGSANCPLCKLFDESCTGCPVSYTTGFDCCGETPYVEWHVHSRDAHANGGPWVIRRKGCKACLDIAKKELAFLGSLRPAVRIKSDLP